MTRWYGVPISLSFVLIRVHAFKPASLAHAPTARTLCKFIHLKLFDWISLAPAPAAVAHKSLYFRHERHHWLKSLLSMLHASACNLQSAFPRFHWKRCSAPWRWRTQRSRRRRVPQNARRVWCTRTGCRRSLATPLASSFYGRLNRLSSSSVWLSRGQEVAAALAPACMPLPSKSFCPFSRPAL